MREQSRRALLTGEEMINKDLLKSGAPYLNDEALERFDKYAEMLVAWNEKINLTSITEPDEIVKKHFLDSLAILDCLDLPEGSSLIDVGTGAGFPGIPLLIARPDLKITLLDSTQKKLGVIEDILNKMCLSAETVHARAEEAAKDPAFREQFDFATARAVANLRELSEYCLPFVRIGGKFISLKGPEGEEELKEAEKAIAVLGGKVKCINRFELDDCGKRTIISIKKINFTEPKYPRPSGQIKKKPL